MIKNDMIYIGIDPGLDGAIVVRNEDGISVHDTPTLTIQNRKKKKKQCDAYGMAHIFSRGIAP